MGRLETVQHPIDTGTAAVTKSRPYMLSPEKRAIVRDAVAKMLEKGVIEHLNSPWSPPVVSVEKKSEEYRFCTNYRKFNAVTKKNSYPLPRIDDMLEKLKEANYFSTFDLASGYWQIPIYPPDKEKTEFIPHCGFYQYRVIPFGLCNAPSTFQRAIELILCDYAVFIDEVIVHSQDTEGHLKDIRLLFEVVRSANLKLDLKNCVFFRKRIGFLGGHIVSKEGIAVDPEKVAGIRLMAPPKTVKQVQSFLGAAGYYRRFVANFSLDY